MRMSLVRGQPTSRITAGFHNACVCVGGGGGGEGPKKRKMSLLQFMIRLSGARMRQQCPFRYQRMDYCYHGNVSQTLPTEVKEKQRKSVVYFEVILGLFLGKMIPPNASLVKYDNPALVSRNTDKKSPRVSVILSMNISQFTFKCSC